MVLGAVVAAIHLIRSGLTRLGRDECGAIVSPPQHDEFGELGDVLNTASARVSSYRHSAWERALESVVDHLEDAVAIFNPDGELLFANPAMRAALPPDPLTVLVHDLLPAGHPYRRAVEKTLASRLARGPVSAQVPCLEPNGGKTRTLGAQERLILTHVIDDGDHRLVAVMLVARDLNSLNEVRSTIGYSRKLTALSRLSTGVAHAIRNPLNATVIHLELLKQRLLSRDLPVAMEHLSVIAAQMRRLDEVVQGFLAFIRPEDLELRPVSLAALVDEFRPIVAAEARKYGVDLRVEVPEDLPPMRADPGLLRQALLNLALNACQAMPNGGRLRIAGAPGRGRRVEVRCEDTGVGITPEHLDKIFDLYFTTKENGSGLGLSMVYRIVQLHDGEIEVQSTPGRGTTVRLLLPRA